MKKILTKNIKAFTLVEIITVLVIIAILATLLVPSLIGYIEKAKQNALLLETKQIFTAAQTSVSESYGLRTLTTGFKLQGESGKHHGRVTNNMMCRVQKGGSITAAQKTDAEIAISVLKCLDSAPGAPKKQYDFTKSSYNPQGNNNPMTVDDYEKTHNQPGIIISYSDTGKIDFVQFGHDGYIATVTKDSATVEKGAKFSAYPN